MRPVLAATGARQVVVLPAVHTVVAAAVVVGHRAPDFKAWALRAMLGLGRWWRWLAGRRAGVAHGGHPVGAVLPVARCGLFMARHGLIVARLGLGRCAQRQQRTQSRRCERGQA